MSRYELAELEAMLLEEEEAIEAGSDQEQISEDEIEEQVYLDEDGNEISPEEAYKKTDEFEFYKKQVQRLHPIRMGIFKKYWAKYKFNRKKREELIMMFDDADNTVEYWLEDEFVSWKDQIEGAREFINEMESKKIQDEAEINIAGNTVIRTIKDKSGTFDMNEIEYSI